MTVGFKLGNQKGGLKNVARIGNGKKMEKANKAKVVARDLLNMAVAELAKLIIAIVKRIISFIIPGDTRRV